METIIEIASKFAKDLEQDKESSLSSAEISRTQQINYAKFLASFQTKCQSLKHLEINYGFNYKPQHEDPYLYPTLTQERKLCHRLLRAQPKRRPHLHDQQKEVFPAARRLRPPRLPPGLGPQQRRRPPEKEKDFLRRPLVRTDSNYRINHPRTAS